MQFLDCSFYVTLVARPRHRTVFIFMAIYVYYLPFEHHLEIEFRNTYLSTSDEKFICRISRPNFRNSWNMGIL